MKLLPAHAGRRWVLIGLLTACVAVLLYTGGRAVHSYFVYRQVSALMARADEAFHRGDTAAGIRALKDCLAIDPGYFQATEGLASLYYMKGDRAAAITVYQQALPFVQDRLPRAVLLRNLGQACYLSKQYELAGGYLQESLALEPNSQETRFRIQYMARQQGRNASRP